MARFILRFDCDNVAFEDDPHAEIGRILRDVASRVADGATSGGVIDANGNGVGRFFYEPPEED